MSDAEKKDLTVIAPKGISQDRALADLALGGITNSALIVSNLKTIEGLDIVGCVQSLTDSVNRLKKGNLERTEGILFSQLVSLDALYTKLTVKAIANMGKYPDAMERYLRLALKAQSQCSRTAQTLGDLKNPAPFIQNNKANYQQVNNGVPQRPLTPAHAQENTNPENKLLSYGDNTYEIMDTRRTREAVPVDTELETLGKLDRAPLR